MDEHEEMLRERENNISAQNNMLLKIIGALFGLVQFVLLGLGAWTLSETVSNGKTLSSITTTVADHGKQIGDIWQRLEHGDGRANQ